MAEAPVDQAEEVSAALDRCMRDASAIVLRGYELPTDVQLIGAGQKHQRYFDDRGEAMWNTVTEVGGQAGGTDGMSEDDLFDEGDPFDDPPWKEAERSARERMEGFSRPRAGTVGCPVSWLGRVLPLVESKHQLAVALLIYPHLRWDKAAPIPNSWFDGLRYRPQRQIPHLSQARGSRAGRDRTHLDVP